jgi:hypothetical protein
MSLADELAALAAPRTRVTCHACRLLDTLDGDDREALTVALASRAAAKRVSDVMRTHGMMLPEQHVRDHRNGHA